MQYLVNTKGEITVPKVKAYVVEATSKQEAQIKASDIFSEEYGVPSEYINANSHKRTTKGIIACVLMLIPFALSMLNWTIGHDRYSITPDAMSCLFAILIYSAFVVKIKGVRRTIGTGIDIALTVICILLLSTFINSLLTFKTFDLLIFDITVDTRVLLIFTVILSWLGLKVVSVICMAVIFIFAVSNIIKINEAMGVWGIVFILCSFFGILFYLSVEPAVMEAEPLYKNMVFKGRNRIREDVMEAGETVKSVSSRKNDEKNYLDRED